MDAKEYERQLKDAESKLDRLRALYEQYFIGIERLEPTIPKKELDRRLAALRKVKLRNTGLRFRTQRLIQKYTSYQTYWKRTARQIEEGTYRRDVMRARQRRDAARAGYRSERPGAASYDIDIDVDMSMDDALFGGPDVDAVVSSFGPAAGAAGDTDPAPPPAHAPAPKPAVRAPVSSPRPAPPLPSAQAAPAQAASAKVRPPATVSKAFPKPSPSPAAPRPPLPSARKASPEKRPAPPLPGKGVPKRPAPPLPGKGDDPELRRIYQKYVDARRSNNERVDNVRFENVAGSIKKMLPKLKEKHQGKRIDFEVVVKDGKVGLKPVTKDK